MKEGHPTQQIWHLRSYYKEKKIVYKYMCVINSLGWIIAYCIHEIGTACYGKEPIKDLGIDKCDC